MGDETPERDLEPPGPPNNREHVDPGNPPPAPNNVRTFGFGGRGNPPRPPVTNSNLHSKIMQNQAIYVAKSSHLHSKIKPFHAIYIAKPSHLRSKIKPF